VVGRRTVSADDIADDDCVRKSNIARRASGAAAAAAAEFSPSTSAAGRSARLIGASRPCSGHWVAAAGWDRLPVHACGRCDPVPTAATQHVLNRLSATAHAAAEPPARTLRSLSSATSVYVRAGSDAGRSRCTAASQPLKPSAFSCYARLSSETAWRRSACKPQKAPSAATPSS